MSKALRNLPDQTGWKVYESAFPARDTVLERRKASIELAIDMLTDLVIPNMPGGYLPSYSGTASSNPLVSEVLQLADRIYQELGRGDGE